MQGGFAGFSHGLELPVPFRDACRVDSRASAMGLSCRALERDACLGSLKGTGMPARGFSPETVGNAIAPCMGAGSLCWI